MTDELDDDVLEDFAPNRRRFVKGIVATTAFAAPLVASFDLTTLSTSNAYANTLTSNATTSTTTTSNSITVAAPRQ